MFFFYWIKEDSADVGLDAFVAGWIERDDVPFSFVIHIPSKEHLLLNLQLHTVFVDGALGLLMTLLCFLIICDMFSMQL